MNAPMVFSQLYLPRPLNVDDVVRPFGRLAADPSTPVMVLETYADAEGTHHLLGVAAEHVIWIHRTLRHLLPGLTILPIDPDHPRTDIATAAAITFRPAPLGLLDIMAQSTTTGL